MTDKSKDVIGNSAFQSYYKQADSMTRVKSYYQLVDSMTENEESQTLW